MNAESSLKKLRAWPERQAAAYRGDAERPLGGYLTLSTAYLVGAVSAYLTARRAGRAAPALSPWDVTQLSVATHKLSRMLAKDPIASPIRAPFTAYEGVSAPSELHEEVRGHGLQHSIGELLTCPMCLAQWVATGFSMGLIVAPTATRLALSTFTAVAGADFLQHVYVKLQEATE
jgi:hypothetical protein